MSGARVFDGSTRNSAGLSAGTPRPALPGHCLEALDLGLLRRFSYRMAERQGGDAVAAAREKATGDPLRAPRRERWKAGIIAGNEGPVSGGGGGAVCQGG